MRPLGVSALMLLTTGCELLGGGLVDNVVSEQASRGLPELDGTFSDSFDEADGRWPVTSASEPTETAPPPTDGTPPGDAMFEYRDGAYVVEAGAGRHLVPTAPVTYSSDQDITVSATIRRLDKPGRRLGGVWGVACDADTSASYYFAGVQTTLGVGYAGIGRVEDSRIRSIVPFGEPHQTIDADGDNDVELRCRTGEQGERDLEFTVNGEVVAEGTDRDAPTEPSEVTAGMVIDTSSLPRGRPFVVRFDDFELREAD